MPTVLPPVNANASSTFRRETEQENTASECWRGTEEQSLQRANAGKFGQLTWGSVPAETLGERPVLLVEEM